MPRKFTPEGFHPNPVLSQGVEIPANSRLLVTSGQIGVRTDGTVADGVAEQTRIAFGNLQAVLAGGGMTLDDVVKLTFFLVGEDEAEEFLETIGPLLPQPRPAVTGLFVKALASPALLVEIEAIAAKQQLG